MQQVKLFKGIEGELAALEDEVNDWIRQSGAKILSLTGNIAPQTEKPSDVTGGSSRGRFPPSDVVLIVMYETPPTADASP